MKTKRRVRFDLDTLGALAGEKALTNGEAYFRDGRVQMLAVEPDRVLALVAGAEDYRTELTAHGEEIGGACSCRAFADRGFCKHMVAAALAANAADDGADEIGALARIRSHLKGKGVDALVEMIVDLAARDPVLYRRLDIAATAAGADDRTLEARLRKAIDSATRTGGYVHYREAAGWAAEVDAALDPLADLASGKRGGLALKLAERAIERLERAVEHIDDSDGHCLALLARVRDIHLAAVLAVRPDPVQLADELFAREMESEYGAFDGAAALYADALGETGLAEYRRLATRAWEKLPHRSGETQARYDPSHHRLKDILDIFAERDGDIDARIALRAKDLSSPWGYLDLAEFCLGQGREEDALRWAEEGLWAFEDGPPDERLALFAADRLSRIGRQAEAEAHLWRAFEKAASLELYVRLRKLGGAGARERAVTFLKARLVGDKGSRLHYPADLLIRILAREKMIDAAWATLRTHRASMSVKQELARTSEATHSREALEVYAEQVEELAGAGGQAAYAEAAKLTAHMATLRSAAEQAEYLTALKTRHGRKRNFMKLLA